MHKKSALLTIVVFSVILTILVCGKEAAVEQMQPGDVYTAYLDALNEKNWEQIKQYLANDKIKQMEQAGDVDKSIEMLKMLAAKDVRVIEENIEAEKAIIITIGKVLFSESKGTISFIKEDGAWKIIEESWRSEGADFNIPINQTEDGE